MQNWHTTVILRMILPLFLLCPAFCLSLEEQWQPENEINSVITEGKIHELHIKSQF